MDLMSRLYGTRYSYLRRTQHTGGPYFLGEAFHVAHDYCLRYYKFLVYIAF